MIDDFGEKIAQQEAQRVQMETEIREQIYEMHTDIKQGSNHVTNRKVSEMQVSQDDDGNAAENSKEIDKLKNKIKTLELQIQKVNIDMG